MKLDKINQKILEILVANARAPISKIAKIVSLSKTPVTLRIKQMEDAGLIQGYRAILSPLQLGLTQVAYVQVTLDSTQETALRDFNHAVKQIPEIEECYMLTGGHDYQIKLRSRDMQHFRQVMGDQISTLPHVNSTSSYVAMEAIIEQNWINA